MSFIDVRDSIQTQTIQTIVLFLLHRQSFPIHSTSRLEPITPFESPKYLKQTNKNESPTYLKQKHNTTITPVLETPVIIIPVIIII